MSLVQEIGREKADSGRGVFDPAREARLLSRLGNENGGPLSEKALRSIYQIIFSSARAIQKRLSIAYVGSEWSECHHAAIDIFGLEADYGQFAERADAARAVRAGKCDYWVTCCDPGNGFQEVAAMVLPRFGGKRFLVVAAPSDKLT
ncbi:MAG TPA: chorismate mutase [Verrucomicrobiae bacterium]|nr:chorismate mutase [Verrucomicrobiae bacterium]